MNEPKVKKVIEQAKLFLEQGQNKREYRVSNGSFQNGGKVSFVKVALLVVNLLRRTIFLELNDFFTVLELGEKQEFSPSAFSQSRYKLEPCFFVDWNKDLKKNYYAQYQGDLKQYHGYFLQAVDGTRLYLPKCEEIIDYFGVAGNDKSEVPMAQALLRTDVLNEFIERGEIAPIGTSEIELALPHLSDLDDNVISIYDRYYPSIELIYEHERYNQKYVMRARLNFNKEVTAFIQSGERERITEFSVNSYAAKKMEERGIKIEVGQLVKVRLIRIELESGEIEILITNLFEQDGEWVIDDIDLIYDFRWGVETCIDHLKNKICLELFAGQKPKAIFQEFHAAIFTLNLQTVLMKDCEKEVEEISLKRQLDYKVNRNVSLGLMKNLVGLIFTEKVQDNLAIIIRTLQKKFIKTLSAVRAGRSYKRKKRAQRKNGKYRAVNNYRPL